MEFIINQLFELFTAIITLKLKCGIIHTHISFKMLALLLSYITFNNDHTLLNNRIEMVFDNT